MAPVALLRCCIFWSALFAYGAQRRVRASGVALMQRRFPFQACLSPSPISITRATTERGTPCLCPSRKPQRASSCGAADTRHVDAPCAACATAPDAAPALQLTITGAANLAAAQREAAASNSSYEIVRSACSAIPQTLVLGCSCSALFGAGGEPPIIHGHHGLRRRVRALLRRRTARPAGLAHRWPRGPRLGRCRRRAERDSRERALGLQDGCRWRAQRRSGEAQRPCSCAGSARRAPWLRLGAAAGAGFPGGNHLRRRLPGHVPQRRLCRGAFAPCAVRLHTF